MGVLSQSYAECQSDPSLRVAHAVLPNTILPLVSHVVMSSEGYRFKCQQCDHWALEGTSTQRLGDVPSMGRQTHASSTQASVLKQWGRGVVEGSSG